MDCNLDTAAIIIEGAMRLHNFLVDYRERYISKDDAKVENNIFTQDVLNSIPRFDLFSIEIVDMRLSLSAYL